MVQYSVVPWLSSHNSFSSHLVFVERVRHSRHLWLRWEGFLSQRRWRGRIELHLKINEAARWWGETEIHQQLSHGLFGPEDDEVQEVPGVREYPAIECNGDKYHSESKQGLWEREGMSRPKREIRSTSKQTKRSQPRDNSQSDDNWGHLFANIRTNFKIVSIASVTSLAKGIG